ncbi:MAG: hypothetical protein NC124_02285 [Clostridium sp.]|nr:hypothetical protein [Clostridium sp.]
MVAFVKFINEHEVELAPQNKGNILNYNLDEKLMREDGFLPLVELTKPGENYLSYFVLQKEQVVKKWKKNNSVIQEIAELCLDCSDVED